MADVSVIVPTTRPHLLPLTLKSVDAQTDAAREVIVLEDREREGPAVVRNRGAERAQGEFLAFLDDDDVWAPQFLERVTVPSQCVLAYTALPHLLSLDPREGSPTVPSAAVIRADAFRAVGGFRPYPLAEDYDLFLRLRRHGPFHRIEEPLCRYAVRADPDRHLALRIHTIAVLEDYRARYPAEFGRVGRRNLGQEYQLLAEALRGRPGLTADLRRVQRAAAATSLRLRPHIRGLRAWGASFVSRGRDIVPLPPRPPTLQGRVLRRLYEGAVTSRS